MPIADDQFYPEVRSLQNALTFQEAERSKDLLTNELRRVRGDAQDLHTVGRDPNPAMRSVFEALAKKPVIKHSVPNIVARWNKLYDRFIFPTNDVDFPQIANPALIPLAQQNYDLVQVWCKAYEKLDKNLEADLVVLQRKREIAQEVDKYLHGKMSFIKFRDLDKEKQQDWKTLLADLDREIALRIQFIESMQQANRVEEMFRLTLEMEKSTVHGVYRLHRYPNFIAPIKLHDLKEDEPTPEEKIKKTLQLDSLDSTLDLPADIADANPLTYVATPSYIQTVQAQYAKATSDKTVIGKHTEFYRQEDQTRHRHITQIKIHAAATDPVAYANQIVDIASHYFLNCHKTQDLQPQIPIVLNGVHSRALCTVLVALGVKPNNIEMIGGVPSLHTIKDDKELSEILKLALQQKPAILQLLKPIPEDGRIFKKFRQIKHEVQRHGDTDPAYEKQNSPALANLRFETQLAVGALAEVPGMPELFKEINTELEASKIAPPPLPEDEEEAPDADGMRLNI